MKQVKLQYRPIGFIPVQWSITRNIPEGWHEINASLLVTISLFTNGLITQNHALSALFKIRKGLAKKLNSWYQYKLFELFEFINNLNPHENFIIKKIGKYKSPANRLKGVSFGCFIYAESYCTNYYNENKPEDLNKFIACYYSNKAFNENDIEARARQIDKIPDNTKQAILLNYMLIKQWLAKSYPYIFVRPLEEDEPKTKKKKEKKKLQSYWLSIFDSIVGDDIVNSDKYADLPVTQVLRYLNKNQRKRRTNGSKS